MFHFNAALSFLAIVTLQVLAQEGNYTVWSSVIFQRTGDRTPEAIANGTEAIVLTSLGQQQAYRAGSYFRNRYIGARYNGVNGSRGADDQGAPMPRLAPNTLDNLQTYAIALDQQYNIATALAWFQGMYPPFSLDSSTFGPQLDPDNTVVLNNDTSSGTIYLDGPLNGYQYPSLHVSGPYDPNFVYLDAHLECPAYAAATNEYTQTPDFGVTHQQFGDIYRSLSSVFGDLIPYTALDYYNAYAIYDWVNYQNTHNETITTQLASLMVNSTNTPHIMDTLRWLASEQQFAQLGNLTAINPFNDHNYLPETLIGSISTIAGNMLAYKVVDLLTNSIQHNPAGMFQLNVLFADYAPLMSFFALMDLQRGPGGDQFTGMANFGASAAFELFSYETEQNPAFPATSNLNVRFMFRNGTDESTPFRSFPLFGRSNGEEDMMLDDFLNKMNKYIMGDVGNWCTQCGAENLFCTAFNASSNEGNIYVNGNLYTVSAYRGLKPAVAGAIGAVATLAVAALVFVAFMVLGGVRFHRHTSRRQSDLGGFKGGQKMASDQDLNIPKGGAIVGASIEQSPTSPTGGHERVGSWELKQAEAGRNWTAGMRRTPDITEGAKPVKPLERV